MSFGFRGYADTTLRLRWKKEQFADFFPGGGQK
jgi:hypothetical protein